MHITNEGRVKELGENMIQGKEVVFLQNPTHVAFEKGENLMLRNV
jgi:hypothetical protein